MSGAGHGIYWTEQHMSRVGDGVSGVELPMSWGRICIYGTEQPMSGAGDGISRAQ